MTVLGVITFTGHFFGSAAFYDFHKNPNNLRVDNNLINNALLSHGT